MTLVDAQGSMGPVKMIFTVIKRKNVQSVVDLIGKHNPSAFYSVEDVKKSSQGVFTKSSSSALSTVKKMFPTGKSK